VRSTINKQEDQTDLHSSLLATMTKFPPSVQAFWIKWTLVSLDEIQISMQNLAIQTNIEEK
jgi:hypothetical protein